MPHILRHFLGDAKARLKKTFYPFKSMPLTLSVVIVLLMIAIYFVWERLVLPQEKGQYSPFQSGVSLLDFISWVVAGNFLIAVAANKRDKVWVILPLIVSVLLLVLTLHYLIIILRFD